MYSYKQIRDDITEIRDIRSERKEQDMHSSKILNAKQK
jgi:hypothetical protein